MEEAKGCERMIKTEDKDKLLSFFSSKNMRSGEIYLGYLDQEMCLIIRSRKYTVLAFTYTSSRHYIIIVELVEKMKKQPCSRTQQSSKLLLLQLSVWRHIFVLAPKMRVV